MSSEKRGVRRDDQQPFDYTEITRRVLKRHKADFDALAAYDRGEWRPDPEALRGLRERLQNRETA